MKIRFFFLSTVLCYHYFFQTSNNYIFTCDVASQAKTEETCKVKDSKKLGRGTGTPHGYKMCMISGERKLTNNAAWSCQGAPTPSFCELSLMLRLGFLWCGCLWVTQASVSYSNKPSGSLNSTWLEWSPWSVINVLHGGECIFALIPPGKVTNG